MARKSWLTIAAAAAGIAVGAVAERSVVGRARARAAGNADGTLGTLRGNPTGPLSSFDGTLLNVEEIGTGPTVIFSHGYSLQNRFWHYQVRDLSGRYRLVMYDQRGHGLSEPARAGDWSLEGLAKDLMRVIEHSKAERVVVVGHSMGGTAALKAFEMYPDAMNAKLAGLVLADTTSADVLPGMLGRLPDGVVTKLRQLGETATHAVLSFDRNRLQRLRERTTDLGWIMVRLSGFGPNASSAQVAFMEKLLAECSIDTWIDLIPAVTGVDVTAALPQIHVPTLVMVGTHDRLTPRSRSEILARSIQGAELAMIAGAGHTPMLECPHLFNSRLRTFLDGLDWSAGPGLVESSGT